MLSVPERRIIPPGEFTLADLALLSGGGGTPVPLTLSGNEITPATRAAATQGDGLTGPYQQSSIGVWEATTNLVTNGGFETNTTGWAAVRGAAISRDTTRAKFGAASLKIVTDGSQNNQGTQFSTLSMTSGQDYRGSFYVWAPIGVTVIIALSDNSDEQTATIAGNDDWQRVSVLNNSASTGSTKIIGALVQGSPSPATTIYIDGVQVENQPLATPCVHADGGTASRSASRVQIPNITRYITATQGYAAFLLRPGWTNTQDPSGNPVVFDWRDDANNLLQLRFDTTNDQWEFQRRNTGGTAEVTVADTFTRDTTLVFLVASWTATDLYLSLDGATPGTASGGNIPTLAATAMDIGSIAGTSEHADSLFLFKALGKTAITTIGSAAALNNIARNNRIDSRVEDLPGGSTFKWPPADGDWRNGVAL